MVFLDFSTDGMDREEVGTFSFFEVLIYVFLIVLYAFFPLLLPFASYFVNSWDENQIPRQHLFPIFEIFKKM